MLARCFILILPLAAGTRPGQVYDRPLGWKPKRGYGVNHNPLVSLVAGAGFEPATRGPDCNRLLPIKAPETRASPSPPLGSDRRLLEGVPAQFPHNRGSLVSSRRATIREAGLKLSAILTRSRSCIWKSAGSRSRLPMRTTLLTIVLSRLQRGRGFPLRSPAALHVLPGHLLRPATAEPPPATRSNRSAAGPSESSCNHRYQTRSSLRWI